MELSILYFLCITFIQRKISLIRDTYIYYFYISLQIAEIP